MLYSFNLAAVVAIRGISCSGFISFIVGPRCAVQDLEGCFFGFGWKAVHPDDVVGIVVRLCCRVEDSVRSSGVVGRGCLKGCILNFSVCFSEVTVPRRLFMTALQ